MTFATQAGNPAGAIVCASHTQDCSFGALDTALAHTLPGGPCSDVLIYIFGCVFFPEALKHKVIPFSAGLLRTISGEQVLETKADNREVDYSELLVNLKT